MQHCGISNPWRIFSCELRVNRFSMEFPVMRLRSYLICFSLKQNKKATSNMGFTVTWEKVFTSNVFSCEKFIYTPIQMRSQTMTVADGHHRAENLFHGPVLNQNYSSFEHLCPDFHLLCFSPYFRICTVQLCCRHVSSISYHPRYVNIQWWSGPSV